MDLPFAGYQSVLFLAQLGFTLWMLVDAYQRGAEHFWFWIILIFQPLGAWGYFFAVKLRTLRSPFPSTGEPLWKRPASVEELRYRVERAPTVVNRLALAKRLLETGDATAAIPYLESVLAFEPNHCDALHALAECRLACRQPELAVSPLEKLLATHRQWENYRAWHTLIQAHEQRGQAADALKACRDLERHNPTLEHRCLLAEHLLENQHTSEAEELLHQALEDYHYAPFGRRWRNRTWAKQARQLLHEAENGARP